MKNGLKLTALAATAAVGAACAAIPAASVKSEQPVVEPPVSAHPRGKPDAPLPKPEITLQPGRVALVVTDPQNDFLSPDGVTWGVVGESVTENGTVEHIGQLFEAAHANDIPVFISPHYYFPHDHGWKFEGALEKLMHNIGMFDREDALSLEGFEGSGADWLEQYKPHIEHENTIVTSPHKVYGPETNDLVLQLRKRGIDQVVLAGMSANLCTESHMRELLEQGFEVIGERDAEMLRSLVRGEMESEPLVRIDYVSLAHDETLVELEGEVTGFALLSLAAHVGATHLIDNVTLGRSAR